ncbi:MAG: phytoene desaturase family protein [Pseudomonadota bacterium]
MNIQAPAINRPRSRVAVIGAGPGGLAAAMQLAAAGARVTLYEKDAVVGGRTRVLTTPEGYRFDLGPTFFLYPRILAEIFETCGTRLEDEVDLIRLDPLYRLIFDGEQRVTINATADMPRMAEEIAKLCPHDARNLGRFMAENRAKLEKFRPVLERAFHSKTDLLGFDMLKALRLMRPYRSVDADLGAHFNDPRVRLAFSFQTKYLGMSPFRCPSLFTILSFLEYEHGVFHPRGGCGTVSEAMARVAERLGVEIKLSTPIDSIAFEGRRAVGVEVGGVRHPADAVVVNGDFAHAVPKLIPNAVRKHWTNKRIEKARYSCSTFMLYLGVEGTFPQLAHHSILLSADYKRNIAEIEGGIIPDMPSVYVQNPVVTDASMAPPGHSAIYVLIPVPNLRHGADWSAEAPRYRALAIERIKALGIPDIEQRIRYEHNVTPQMWHDDYAIGYGATFNLSHDLGQMLCFRPGNRFADAEGVYLVGGGTHPGSGLPVIYEGARITAGLVAQDLGFAPTNVAPAHAVAAVTA